VTREFAPSKSGPSEKVIHATPLLCGDVDHITFLTIAATPALQTVCETTHKTAGVAAML
jgi:hypothetical protein